MYYIMLYYRYVLYSMYMSLICPLFYILMLV